MASGVASLAWLVSAAGVGVTTSRLEMCGNGFQHSLSLPFQSIMTNKGHSVVQTSYPPLCNMYILLSVNFLCYKPQYRSTPRKRYECEAQPQSKTVAQRPRKSHDDSDMLLVRNCKLATPLANNWGRGYSYQRTGGASRRAGWEIHRHFVR